MLELFKSYQKCMKIYNENYKKEYVGLYILGYSKLKHFAAFFSLIKIIDDITKSNNELIKKKHMLFNFEKIFFALYKEYKRDNTVGEIIGDYKPEYKLFFQIHRAIFDTLEKIDIGNHNIESIFKAKRMDLDKVYYQNFGQLEIYVSNIGEVVAEFLYLLVKEPDPSLEIFDYIYTLGRSIHLNNIIYSVKEDFDKKPLKVYLPLDEQEECDFLIEIDLPEILNKKTDSIKFNKLINYQLNRLDKYYEYSQVGIQKIDPKFYNIINCYISYYLNQNKKILDGKFNILEDKKEFSYYDFFNNVTWYNMFIIFLNFLYMCII